MIVVAYSRQRHRLEAQLPSGRFVHSFMAIGAYRFLSSYIRINRTAVVVWRYF